MSAQFEIYDLSLAPFDPKALWGRNIDYPKSGAVLEGATLTIVGWVLGRDSPATSVEVVSGGRVLELVPVHEPRPDVVSAFPQATNPHDAGFRVTLGMAGRAQVELELRAVLEDESRVPLATVRARRRLREEDLSEWSQLVSVIVRARNQAHELEGCIESVLAQTYPHFEVVVVDDGSSDTTGEVARRRAGVRVLERPDAGSADARNAGLAATGGAFVVFLDADDRLLPQALERGLAELAAHPEYAFASGFARVVGGDPDAPVYPQQPLVPYDHYEQLLQNNYVLSHAAVMYRRVVFSEIGQFDSQLPALSEYDLYLRIAREFPVGCYAEKIVEDRKYARRADVAEESLRAGLEILARQRRRLARKDPRRVALDVGEQRWREQWGGILAENARRVRAGDVDGTAGRPMRTLARHYPRGLSSTVKERRPSDHSVPRVGGVDFGDLRQLRPMSGNFGYDRGTPVDRYYIEGYLNRQREHVRGRVLEVQENAYTQRFGGERVTASHVLSLTHENPLATLVGDLGEPGWLPESAFDCALVTQTLHLVYDCRTALAGLARSLAPGGVLLITTPGVTQVEWGEEWQWGFTVPSLLRLLGEAFGSENIAVESHGNVLAATAFLQGIAVEELEAYELDYADLCYPLVLAARATRSE